MIKSMTGYGKSESLVPARKIIVEIRSLNSKQLDLTLKCPHIYRAFEYDLRTMAAKRAVRGKVEVAISYEPLSAVTPSAINKELFGAYYRQLKEAATENGMAWSVEIEAQTIPALLKLPEVVKSDVSTTTSEDKAALFDTVERAFDAFDAFREQEGNMLITDLVERIGTIERLKNEVTPYENARSEMVKKRIRENIAALNLEVDSNRLEQEMIYYIEKLDITEEKVRLQNHCDYFRQVAGEEDGVGRKLGFISQEIGREINTMGSKANEANIQKIVVQMKDELEKIKEQLLNIL